MTYKQNDGRITTAATDGAPEGGRVMPEITDRQRALLCDLYALQKAGYIENGHEKATHDGWGSTWYRIPAVLTNEGMKLVEQMEGE